MSLNRLIYYAAILGGWAAFAGWLVCEVLFQYLQILGTGLGQVMGTAAVVGAAIGGGLGLVTSLASGGLAKAPLRVVLGLLGGGVGGIVGGFLGNLIFSGLSGLVVKWLPESVALFTLWALRGLGWMMLGTAIGIMEGVYDQSAAKLRNGLIGGALGGLLGGLLFQPVAWLVSSPTGMLSRAAGFVLLGLCIGALISLVRVVLKEAWLTVLDGYKPGRQLVLTETVTMLGRAEHLPLPFLGNPSRDLEMQHASITRERNGDFVLEDQGTRIGTLVNNQAVPGTTVLSDGDVIKLGGNMVRFNVRQKSAQAGKDDEAAPARRSATPAAGIPTAKRRPQSSEPPQVLPVAEPPLVLPASPPLAAPPRPPMPAAPAAAPAPRPVAAPAAPAPPRPAPAAPTAPAAAPGGAKPAPAADACPGCGRKMPGAKGTRYCIVCDRTF